MIQSKLNVNQALRMGPKWGPQEPKIGVWEPSPEPLFGPFPHAWHVISPKWPPPGWALGPPKRGPKWGPF